MKLNFSQKLATICLSLVLFGLVLPIFAKADSSPNLKSTDPAPLIKPNQPEPRGLPKVMTQVLKQGSYLPNLLIPAQVEAVEYPQLKSIAAGQIKRVYVAEGEVIHKNQLLLELDKRKLERDIAYQQSYIDEVNAKIKQLEQTHKVNLDNLAQEKKLLQIQERTIQRLEGLIAEHLIPDTEIDNARASEIKQQLSISQRQLVINSYDAELIKLKNELQRYELTMQQLKDDLANCQIMAPYEARITKLYSTEGDYIKLGEPILAAYDLSKPVINATIPADYLDLIKQKLDESSSLTVMSLNRDKMIQFQLNQVIQNKAKFSLTQGLGSLTIGQNLRLCLNLPPVKAYAVSSHYVDENNQIYIVRKGRVKNIIVQIVGEIYDLKRLDNKQLLIRSELIQEGDQLIISSLKDLQPDMQVVAITKKTSPV